MLSKTWAIALVFALVVAACGGSNDDSAPEDGDQMEEEAMADDAMNEEAMDEEMTDEAMADDMSDEAMDEEMTDEAMSEHMATTFTVTIDNTSNSTELPTPLAPGAFAVHSTMDTMFAEGQVDRGEGLEALAEDGDPSGLVASLDAQPTVSVAGSFANPDNAAEAGPALPGSTYSFTFEAMPGDYLSFATMFVQSNDWFFAPQSSGIKLFDGESPVAGDITDLIGLWDAGTEVDETPGEGPNQAPRQAGPDTGDDQGAPVTAVSGFDGAVKVTVSVNG